jgi:RNA polymerase subunit RPABC4/transcription elongation factor Spt4
VRLFKRKQESEPTPCPRCSQLVPEAAGSVCPMCGWDLHDAYQGPTIADEPVQERAGARAGGWGGAA